MMVAIIGIVVLAALALPIYRAVSSAAKATECVNRLRKIYFASLAFAEDHGGRLPPGLSAPPYEDADARFHYNTYWWRQAYLARYVLDDLNRRKDSAGRLSQAEAEAFNCPARHVEGPDHPVANGNPAVSYVMVSRQDSGEVLRRIENKSKLIYITEGRGSTVSRSTFRSGEMVWPDDAKKRLRRYHNGAINLLFFDGHVEQSTQPDEVLAQMLP